MKRSRFVNVFVRTAPVTGVGLLVAAVDSIARGQTELALGLFLTSLAVEFAAVVALAVSLFGPWRQTAEAVSFAPDEVENTVPISGETDALLGRSA